MKKLVLVSLLLFSINECLSQESLLPEKSKTFALNHHTNRDIPYFLHKDSNGNTVVVSTTERDSTFTDVLTTKLDVNLNVLWQKRTSIDTNLSFDIPIKSFLGVNNEIYILGRSRFNETIGTSGLIFISKISEYGDVLYTKTLGEVDGSDYYNFGFVDADVYKDGSVRLVYAPVDKEKKTSTIYNFLTIDNSGEIINSFSKQIFHSGIVCKIFKGSFYLLVRGKMADDDSNSIYNFYRIMSAQNMASLAIDDDGFVDYYNNYPLEGNVKLSINEDDDCFITFQHPISSTIKEGIHFVKINRDNELVYSILSPDDEKLAFVNSFIDSNNKNIIIVNDLLANSTGFFTIDDTNSMKSLKNLNNTQATGFKLNLDESFFLTSSNSKLKLYSNELNELKEFNTSDTYELKDFVKFDESTIVTAGLIYGKMFPESDFTTQLDLRVEKIRGDALLQEYEYSGEGTSRSFQQKIILDHDGNYLVLVTEKMGPEYLGIGGANPPLNNRIIKFDPDLNVLWEQNFPEHVSNVVHLNSMDTRYTLDGSNNLYLNLPVRQGATSTSNDLYKVSSDGVISFVTNSIPAKNIFAENDNIHIGSITYRNSSTNVSQFSYYKVDKNTGITLAEEHIENEHFLTLFKNGGDIFFYTYKGPGPWIDTISLYKNGIKIYSRYLSKNNGIAPIIMDEKGTLFFITYFANSYQINKLDIDNIFINTQIVRDVKAIKQFDNGNIYVCLEGSHNTLIYDSNLNYLRNGKPIDTDGVPYLVSYKNQIIVGYNDDKVIKVIDENGQIVADYRTKGFMQQRTTVIGENDKLIMVGEFGSKIYTYNEFSWFRAFIDTYKIFPNTLSTSDVQVEKDELSIYPNPTSAYLSIKSKHHFIKTVRLYDLTGKLLKEFNSSQINLTNLKAGIYILKVETMSNSIFNAKIIKT